MTISYEKFGLKEVINASGRMTILGVSKVSENVLAAQRFGGEHFFEMSVEETPQTLLVIVTTGETAEVDLSLLNLSDRTSNGSFIEGLADKEVFSAKIIEK